MPGNRLEMEHITKRFGSVVANEDVSLSLDSGEIIGLLGENGAGKTTLMNILFGLYRAEEGRITIDGVEQSFRSPKDAMKAGIGMVHQHFMLVQNHSVVENLALGYTRSPRFFPQREIARKVEEYGRHLGLLVEPKAMVYQLSAGEQQRVEIVRALLNGAEILILDEPTSVLSPVEAKELFAILRRMAAEGTSIILISHKLEDILSVCSRVVILRKGRNAGESPVEGVDRRPLATMMVGRELTLNVHKPVLERGARVLEVQDLHVLSDRGEEAVHGASFSLYRNEIFGIAGVSGNGQRELVEAISGLRKSVRGHIHLNGINLTNTSARRAAKEGIAHVPEERIKFGIVPNLMIYENSVLKSHRDSPFSQSSLMDYGEIREHAESIVRGYKVAASSIRSPMKNLSGGNIQKLIIGREIANEPDLLIAAHPTYGLDVGASEEIHQRMVELRSKSCSVLLVSEDLEEVLALSDRVAVMFRGRFMGVFRPGSIGLDDIGLMMAGSKRLPEEDEHEGAD